MSPLIGDASLEGALEKIKGQVPRTPEQLRIALYICLCSYTLLQSLYAEKNKHLEPEDIKISTITSWAVEFFSQYDEDNSDFDTTYAAFVSWLKSKQFQYISNFS